MSGRQAPASPKLPAPACSGEEAWCDSGGVSPPCPAPGHRHSPWTGPEPDLILGPSNHHHPSWGYWNGLHTLCLASLFRPLQSPGQAPECPFETKVGSRRLCSAKRSNDFLSHLPEEPTSFDWLLKSLLFSLTSSSAVTCQSHRPRWRPGIQAANSCLRAFELPFPLREVLIPWRSTCFAPLPASVTELKGCSRIPPISNSTPTLPPHPPLLTFL